MKCEFCAGTLSIEDERCPHCDAPNPYYDAHRKDMQHYKREFDETEREVIEKTHRFTKRGFYVLVICVLVLLNVVMGVLIAASDDINYERNKAYKIKHAAEYAAEAKELEENNDFVELYALLNANFYYSGDSPLREYTTIHSVSSDLFYSINAIGELVCHMNPSVSASEYAKRLAGLYDRLYDEIYERAPLYSEQPEYSKEHMESVKKVMDELSALYETYLGIDKDTLDTFPEISSTKRQMVFEEAIEEMWVNEEK